MKTMRWVSRSDVSEIVSFSTYSHRKLTKLLKSKYVLGLVSENEFGGVVGFLAAKFDNVDLSIEIIHVVVDPVYRRDSHASALVGQLVTHVSGSWNRRTSVKCLVSERNVSAQLFFKSLGFKVTKVFSNWFGKHCDGYEFNFMADPNWHKTVKTVA